MKNYRELSSKSPEEITLLNNDNTEDFPQTARKRRTRDPLVIVVLVEALLLLLGAIYLVTTRIYDPSCKQSSSPSNKNLLYSPVQDIVKEQIKVFDDGQKGTIYQGHGPNVDKAWTDLYDMVKAIILTRAEAERIPNKTYPAEVSPGYYLGGLDVFHQLHCLNKVRLFAQGALGHGIPNITVNHLDHCVESLRQSVMCQNDISVMPWQWDEKGQRATPRFDYPRVCRNFEDIRDWAIARKPEREVDMNLFIVDDLPTPPIIYA